MNAHTQATENQYGTLQHKSFESAVFALLAAEFPNLSGTLARKALASALGELARKFHPESSHVAAGQIVWIAAATEAKGSYGAKIEVECIAYNPQGK